MRRAWGWLGCWRFRRRLRRAVSDVEAQAQLSNRYMTEAYGQPRREACDREQA